MLVFSLGRKVLRKLKKEKASQLSWSIVLPYIRLVSSAVYGLAWLIAITLSSVYHGISD
jgi:hypothetical protein